MLRKNEASSYSAATTSGSTGSSVLVCDAGGSQSSVQGGGGGQFSVQAGGSMPGLCVSPAATGSESRHSNASAGSSFLTVDSPLVEWVEKDERAPAVIVHCNPITDPDLVLFRSLADRKDFDSLTQLCRERLLTARDGLSSLRWTKDRAIVEAIQGRHANAYDLLASVHFHASVVSGRPRGLYEDEFGLILARLGRSSLALERFNVAYQNGRAVGDGWLCAAVDHNRARALHTRGEHAKATRYLKRALDYARANNDFRLEMEVCESIVEFGGEL